MKKMIRFLVISFCLISIASVSQNNIYLVDGKIVEFDSININIDDSYIIYSYHNRRNVLKTNYFEFTEVFSVTQNGNDTIIYYPIDEDELSVENMQYFLNGIYDCKKYHKSHWFFYSGLLVGAGAAILPIHNMVSLTIPIAYSTGTTFIKPNEERINSLVSQPTNNEYYVMGYQNAARNKNLKSAIWGSVGGLAVGAAVIFVVSMIGD